MSNRVPCKYFKQGRCNKGNNCPFYHGNTYTYNNNNNNNNRNNQGTSSPFWSSNLLDDKADEIRSDLQEKTNFQNVAFSSYSLLTALLNLIPDRDMSPEEMRLLYIQNPQQYEQQFQARTNDFKKVTDFLRKDTRKAARFLQVTTEHASKNNGDLSKVRPYIDFQVDLTNTANNGFGTSNSFGGNGGSSFGQNPFSNSGGSSLFGSSGFGTSSAFGSAAPTSAPAFGSSGFGAKPSSEFSSTAPASAPAFGTTNFGATNNTSSTFGSSSTTPAYGSSAFGAKPAATSTFGSSATSAPAFGSSGSFGSSSFGTFGTQKSSPFGNILQNGNSTTPFGSGDSPFSNIGNKSNSSPFATAAATTTNTENKPSLFGSSTTTTTATQTQPSTAFGSSGFGSSAPNPFGTSSNSAFGSSNTTNKPASASPFGNLNATLTTSPFGNLTSQKEPQPAQPTTTMPAAKIETTKLPQQKQTIEISDIQIYSVLDELSENVKQLFLSETFELGRVPEIAPPIELC